MALTNKPDFYLRRELKKHIDPVLWDYLPSVQVKGVTEKQLTVVFWDISGYTDLCNDFINQGYDEEILHFLREYFSKGIEIINSRKGVIDKFIGDGILAYFGYTGTMEEHGEPSVAIEAALEFRSSFLSLKERFLNYWNSAFGIDASYINLKCGLNNGSTFLHYVNTPTRNILILMGKTVNLASRLEDIAKKDEIIASKYVKNMVRGKFELSEIKVTDREKNGIKGFPDEDYVYSIGYRQDDISQQ